LHRIDTSIFGVGVGYDFGKFRADVTLDRRDQQLLTQLLRPDVRMWPKAALETDAQAKPKITVGQVLIAQLGSLLIEWSEVLILPPKVDSKAQRDL